MNRKHLASALIASGVLFSGAASAID